MSEKLARTSEWLYHGVWKILVRWFRVPQEPPVLPSLASEPIQVYRPADGFLRYLKFQFWLALAVFGGGLLFGWCLLLVAEPVVALITLPFAVAVISVPAVLSYVAIHLRYDTTWYVISDRSMRLRRGIWVIRETTITFENIQNVTIDQGPLQRWFEIADVVVKTAGGGSGGGGHGEEGAGMSGGHHGMIEGINNAVDIRNLIMSRLQRSKAAGLGDESPLQMAHSRGGFSSEHVALLRDIRDLAVHFEPAQG